MITPMSRVQIVCLNAVRQELIQFLHDQGVIQLEHAPTAIESAPEFLGRIEFAGEESEKLSRLEGVQRTLAEVRPLLTREPARADVERAAQTVKTWTEDQWAVEVEQWAERLRALTRRKLELQDRLDVLAHYRTIFKTILPALGGNDLRLGPSSRAVVLTGNAEESAQRLDGRLREELGTACTFHYNHMDPKTIVGLISAPEDLQTAVGKILSQEGVGTVDMSKEDYTGLTVAEITKRVEQSIEESQQGVQEAERELERLTAELGPQLVALTPLVNDALAEYKAQQQCSASHMVTVLHGWIPTEQVSELERAVEGRFEGKAVVEDIGHGGVKESDIPTKLNNPKIFQPFEVLLKIFNPPTYGTIDPTPLIATSFIIFYGFILGDAMYGIFVILFAKLLAKKWGHIEAVQSASTIGVYMGISAIIFGILFGEYFGNFVELQVAPALGFELPILFHRSHHPNELLIFGLLFGIIHIPLALMLGIWQNFRHHHSTHAFEQLGMLLGLLAMMVGVCTNFGVPVFSAAPAFFYGLAGLLALAGVALIFYAMKAMGFIGVLEIMSLGGNVLSYSRLMALGIASIALADIANQMPGMFGYAVGIPLALMVHLLNIGIGMASPTIHSLRLNFVEFLPKFYSPEGKPFNPFRKETQW